VSLQIELHEEANCKPPTQHATQGIARLGARNPSRSDVVRNRSKVSRPGKRTTFQLHYSVQHTAQTFPVRYSRRRLVGTIKTRESRSCLEAYALTSCCSFIAHEVHACSASCQLQLPGGISAWCIADCDRANSTAISLCYTTVHLAKQLTKSHPNAGSFRLVLH
jgi:hypothetical protein